MRDEENEHSLEIELPFVYHLFGTNAKVVLIMVGNVSTSEKKKVAKYVLLFSIIAEHWPLIYWIPKLPLLLVPISVTGVKTSTTCIARIALFPSGRISRTSISRELL